MRRTLLALVLGCSVAACGSTPPTAPTPTPTATTWSLSGQVTNTAGGNVIGTTVAILDGANGGKSATADGACGYSLSGLTPGGFSLRASAPGYIASTQDVTLIANTTTNFQLVHVPLAALSYSGSLTFEPVRPDGSYWPHGTITNTGTGCAQSASGVITIVDSTKTVMLSYPCRDPRPARKEES
jgi:hypothetical protein